jgi:pimeloyl-ACP methyl ester carboxylesterase
MFLHGAGVSGRMWADHMARLTDFHCVAPDLPGFGMSNQLPWTSLVCVADDVAELIRTRASAGRAHVVGLSLGGAVAHTLLARHAALLQRVVIDGAGILPWWGNAPYLAFVASIAPFLHTRPVIAALSRSVGRMPEPDQADLKVASRRAFLQSLVAARMTRPTRAETEAQCPTLFVAGERETAVRRSNVALAGAMPRATARYVPALGHGWLGTRMELHVDMVEGWITSGQIPAGLIAERSSPAAERALLRGLPDGH